MDDNPAAFYDYIAVSIDILSTYRQMDALMPESAIAQIPEENPETSIEEL